MEIIRDTEFILMKEQFKLTIESLKPLHLLKETLASPSVKDNIIDSAIGMTSGYIIKKSSDTIF